MIIRFFKYINNKKTKCSLVKIFYNSNLKNNNCFLNLINKSIKSIIISHNKIDVINIINNFIKRYYLYFNKKIIVKKVILIKTRYKIDIFNYSIFIILIVVNDSGINKIGFLRNRIIYYIYKNSFKKSRINISGFLNSSFKCNNNIKIVKDYLKYNNIILKYFFFLN